MVPVRRRTTGGSSASAAVSTRSARAAMWTLARAAVLTAGILAAAPAAPRTLLEWFIPDSDVRISSPCRCVICEESPAFRPDRIWSTPAGFPGAANAAVRSIPDEGSSFSRLAEAMPDASRPWWVRLMLYVMYVILSLVCVYLIRHYLFTINRVFGRQRHPYLDIDTAAWPRVTVLIPAHNEERVIRQSLDAILEADYPRELLKVVPVNDRSEDRTEEIIDQIASEYPDVIRPFHRREGPPGKAAALRDAMTLVESDIILVFDADYIPGRGLVKQLVSPFFDPEVGAVMGRVVPLNVDDNLLTRILDLERAGGYQVDQQARMNLGLVPQYGGTVGGVRRRALQSVGGWRVDCLAEDTDATFRLLLGGWKTVYQNRAECYEQVPRTWEGRLNQIFRWARGHNQSLRRYAHSLFWNRRTRFAERLDGLLLLNVYLLSLIVVIGWGLGIALWYLGVNKPGLIVILIVTSYSTLGNFAVFFQVSAAGHLDGSGNRVRLLPFLFTGFLVSLWSVARATLTEFCSIRRRRDVLWHKTEHEDHNYENLRNGQENGNGNGWRNGGNGRNGQNGRNGRNGGAGQAGRSDPGADGGDEKQKADHDPGRPPADGGGKP